MRELVKYNEFLNEQLFGGKKRAERRAEEQARLRRIADAEVQARRIAADREYREGLEKARRERPQIEKIIDILENHRDLIKKTKYQEEKNEWGMKYYYYGLLTDDDVIIVKRCNNPGVAADNIFGAIIQHQGTIPVLKINGETMSSTKEKKENREIDPLGEEAWEENEITPYEKLCELVKKYVLKNEIIF